MGQGRGAGDGRWGGYYTGHGLGWARDVVLGTGAGVGTTLGTG